MVDIPATADALESAFSQMGPICVKNKSEGFGVIWHSHNNGSKRLALFPRNNFSNPLDAIKEGETPMACFDTFDEIALAGWKLD